MRDYLLSGLFIADITNLNLELENIRKNENILIQRWLPETPETYIIGSWDTLMKIATDYKVELKLESLKNIYKQM